VSWVEGKRERERVECQMRQIPILVDDLVVEMERKKLCMNFKDRPGLLKRVLPACDDSVCATVSRLLPPLQGE
jgi:hypothetical protein